MPSNAKSRSPRVRRRRKSRRSKSRGKKTSLNKQSEARKYRSSQRAGVARTVFRASNAAANALVDRIRASVTTPDVATPLPDVSFPSDFRYFVYPFRPLCCNTNGGKSGTWWKTPLGAQTAPSGIRWTCFWRPEFSTPQDTTEASWTGQYHVAYEKDDRSFSWNDRVEELVRFQCERTTNIAEFINRQKPERFTTMEQFQAVVVTNGTEVTNVYELHPETRQLWSLGSENQKIGSEPIKLLSGNNHLLSCIDVAKIVLRMLGKEYNDETQGATSLLACFQSIEYNGPKLLNVMSTIV